MNELVRRRLKIGASSVVFLGVAFTAVMGFAHTKAGRPLLALMAPMMGKSAKCPLGYDQQATPEQKEATRRAFAATHGSDTFAEGRPALGFKLDETSKDDVTAWAAAHNVTCKVPRSGSDLDCSDVPVAALPGQEGTIPIHSLWFTFDANGKVVGLTAIRRDASVDAISASYQTVTSQVTQAAGPPTSTSGEATPTALASGALYQATSEYRFHNYFMRTRATNMGPSRGFVITEDYKSLPN